MSASQEQSPKMWKPGTAAPSASAGRPQHSRTKTPPRSRSPAGSRGGGAGRGGGGRGGGGRGSSSAVKRNVAKTGLSGATMGMRFMKRKAEAAEAAKRKEAAEAEAKAKAEREQMEWEAAAGKSGGGRDAEEGEAMDEEEDDDCMAPQIATITDMYGAGADIVGRRSFGGFNKAVAETWNESLHMREKVGSGADGEKLSDAELLRKYENVVKGRSGDRPGQRIGNLAEKAKKRRGNAQSGNKEKRKRG